MDSNIFDEGDKCQCLEADEKNEEICRKNGTICNDQGHCVCEKCICDAVSNCFYNIKDTLYYGDFCECNDFNCPSTENGLC
ncbi:hypothetical protein HZS_3945 [Henneguya salminicola]|nr:hypothetical protein HZS_3945 [Henneguya salminicola]